MDILIHGATGFIGTAVAQRLCAAGHAVTGLGRSTSAAARRFPDIGWKRADLRRMTHAEDWREALAGVEVVVNCAGALQDGLRDDLKAVQDQAMRALYTAAGHCGVRRIVQISIPSMAHVAETPFQRTKLDADAALAASGLDHVILRPAVVLGRNAYGGSALLRALASLPCIMPLIHADQPLQAVWLDDIAEAVVLAAQGDLQSGTDHVLADDRPWTVADLVRLHRQWLGLPPARLLKVPPLLARPVSFLADMAGHLGWRSPLRSTALAVTAGGLALVTETAAALPPPRSVREALLASPAGAQDLWFARLYLLKPLLIAGLSLFWLASGIIPLLDIAGTAARFAGVFPPALATVMVVITCLADILLGLAIAYRPKTRLALIGMIALSFAYLLSGTLIEPGLWLDPLGPLVNVVPSILLALVGLAILDER